MKVLHEERNGKLVPVSLEIESGSEVEFLLEQLRPRSEWIFQEFVGGFGKYTRRACKNCGTARAQVPVKFCGACGCFMNNFQEVEAEDTAEKGGAE